MKIGDLRIVSFKHPDSLNQTVWNVEQRILSTGQYSIPGSSHWASATLEPFADESEAIEFMENYKKNCDIKSIDNHEWSDSYIKSAVVIVDRIQINYSHLVDDARLTEVDLKVLANALGYEMVKV